MELNIKVGTEFIIDDYPDVLVIYDIFHDIEIIKAKTKTDGNSAKIEIEFNTFSYGVSKNMIRIVDDTGKEPEELTNEVSTNYFSFDDI